MSDTIGAIGALWRYPVKSLRGESLDAAVVTTAGVEGDRIAAFRDDLTGATASAKRPARWRHLLDFRAVLDQAGDLVVETPDGRRLSAGDRFGAAEVARATGRRVSLTRERDTDDFLERADPEAVMDAGSGEDVEFETGAVGRAADRARFHDFATVHVLPMSSLRRISEAASIDMLEIERYRPNLVIDDEGLDRAEVGWPGRKLHVEDLVLEVTLPTPRCAIPTLGHGDLPPRRDAYLAVARENTVPVLDLGPRACLGVYARVLRPGTIRVGDPVEMH